MNAVAARTIRASRDAPRIACSDVSPCHSNAHVRPAGRCLAADFLHQVLDLVALAKELLHEFGECLVVEGPVLILVHLVEFADGVVRALLNVELAHQFEHFLLVDAAGPVRVGAVPLLLDVSRQDTADGRLLRLICEDGERPHPDLADDAAARDQVDSAIVRDDGEGAVFGLVLHRLELVGEYEIGRILPLLDRNDVSYFNVVRLRGDGSQNTGLQPTKSVVGQGKKR